MNRDVCNDFLGASRKFACIFRLALGICNTYPMFTNRGLILYYNEFNRKIGYQQALLVSCKRESQVGQAPIVPGGFSLPFPWNIIFDIYIVKNDYYCKFCSRNIFYSILFRYRRCRCITLLYLPCIFRLRTETIWVSATHRILIRKFDLRKILMCQ